MMADQDIDANNGTSFPTYVEVPVLQNISCPIPGMLLGKVKTLCIMSSLF